MDDDGEPWSSLRRLAASLRTFVILTLLFWPSCCCALSVLRSRAEATAARGLADSDGGNLPESKQISLLADVSAELVEMFTFAVLDSFIMLLISLIRFFSRTSGATGSGEGLSMLRSITSCWIKESVITQTWISIEFFTGHFCGENGAPLNMRSVTLPS